ncbi:MAG: S41 family peptidase [Candidatus Lernaella stagnicola]|nr:S41 family peptidase [Candidatus Lernaella stagnicola]
MPRKMKMIIAVATMLMLIGGAVAAQTASSFAAQMSGPLRIFTDALVIVHSKYVEELSPSEIVYSALEGMLSRLDPHSAFLRPEAMRELDIDTRGKFEGLGIEITIRDSYIMIISPIDGTPAANAGLAPGDYIVKIDGESTRNITIFEAVKKLRGPAGSSVKINIWRKGWADSKEVEITRAPITVKVVKYRELEPGYGYVKLSQFTRNATQELKKAVLELDKTEGGLKGLVLDLRNNPGGLLDQAAGVSDLFVDDGLIVYTRGRDEDMQNVIKATRAGTVTSVPLTMLINAGSASASEIVAGCLQDQHRAILIGERSFGKGSVQTIVPMPDGSGLKLTTAKYFTPNGREIQAKGIEPDLAVPGDETAGVGKDKPRMLREADLDGHLEGADEEVNDTPDAPGVPPSVTLDEDKKSDDPQLDMALKVLKAWPVFMKAASNKN